MLNLVNDISDYCKILFGGKVYRKCVKINLRDIVEEIIQIFKSFIDLNLR